VSPFSNIAVLVAISVKKYAVAALDGLISALFARLDYSGKILKAPHLIKKLICSFAVIASSIGVLMKTCGLFFTG
jgi:hypothetical protein